MSLVEMGIDGPTAVVTINSPETMNAVSSEVLRELLAAFRSLSDREDVSVIILTGAGSRAFAAGANIREMKEMTPEQARAHSRLGQRVTAAIEATPQPVIAAVNGYALGGGCELALACDIRLSSEKARFGQLEVNLGIMPGWGGTQRLARVAGSGFARELLFTGRMASAEEALGRGLVNAVYPPDDLMERAREMAETIAAKSRVVLQYIKMATLRAFDQDLEAGMQLESDLFGLCFATEDQTEGMDAFLGKRQPEFRGR